jgi:hypothetical protein
VPDEIADADVEMMTITRMLMPMILMMMMMMDDDDDETRVLKGWKLEDIPFLGWMPPKPSLLKS